MRYRAPYTRRPICRRLEADFLAIWFVTCNGRAVLSDRLFKTTFRISLRSCVVPRQIACYCEACQVRLPAR